LCWAKSIDEATLALSGFDCEVNIMRNVPMLAMAFLVVSFCAFKTSTASAQTRTCVLALDVATTDKKFQTRPVNDVRATALNTSSHKSVPAVVSSGQPVFSKLTDGQYRITVSKLGFKRAIKPVTFKCERMNARATMQIDLAPGNFRRSVVARSESINAADVPPPIRRGVTTLDDLDRIDLELKDLVKEQPASSPPAPPKGAVSGGILNGKAISLPRPAYPAIARQAHASGTVVVQVVIDEEGNVIWATAVSGHPLLQQAARQAALGAKFSPTKLSGQAVKVAGVLTYNFVLEKGNPE
jgi:TonB family protein